MITVKITKEVKVQKYMKNGLKIFVNYKNDKNKWFIIKLDKHQVDLLYFILNSIMDNKLNESK